MANKPGRLQLDQPAQDTVGADAETYRDSLISVARGLAHQEGSSKVEKRHVDEAKRTLARQGLKRTKLPTASEWACWAGAAVLSVTFSIPDWLPESVEGDARDYLKFGILAAGTFLAIALYIVAFVLNRR
ncbi:hypothetical protein GC176_00090 [bacterium]|nr:hypothetical protein [bacterium]